MNDALRYESKLEVLLERLSSKNGILESWSIFDLQLQQILSVARIKVWLNDKETPEHHHNFYRWGKKV